MIFETIDFLRKKLEMHIADGAPSMEPKIVLSNPWTSNDGNKNSNFLNAISLINIEEEKVFKSQLPKIVQGQNGQYLKQEPDLKLNLYLLISAYNKNYEDGLKFITKIVSFFQSKNVFTNEERDALPSKVEKLMVELYTASFEQQNQIWASLSTGYLPSVIYKVRMIIVEGEVLAGGPLIKEINTQM